MWSRKFYHSFAQLSTEAIAGFYGVTREYTTFGEVGPFWCSSSQTRRPTNWATPGYEVKEKLAKWSNMWSRKLYHSFVQLSTEVIRGNCEDKGEHATFGAVEPFWCSSSQTRRPTNWATPGSSFMRSIRQHGNYYTPFLEKSNPKFCKRQNAGWSGSSNSGSCGAERHANSRLMCPFY